jgi:hypothetical protein
MIIAPCSDYSAICAHFKKLIPSIRISKDCMYISSGLVNIEIYPWRGNYHWRGHKVDLVYVPKEVMEDLDTLALFQINAIQGIVLPIEIIERRLGLK